MIQLLAQVRTLDHKSSNDAFDFLQMLFQTIQFDQQRAQAQTIELIILVVGRFTQLLETLPAARPKEVDKLSPALFTADASRQGVVAAVVQRVKADGSSSYEDAYFFDAQKKPVAKPIDLGSEREQVYLLLFGSNLRLRAALTDVVVNIGSVPAEVSYAGKQDFFEGVDQINVRLPRSLIGRKEVDVGLAIVGKIANPVKVNIK